MARTMANPGALALASDATVSPAAIDSSVIEPGSCGRTAAGSAASARVAS
jgi:hypothetical protein